MSQFCESLTETSVVVVSLVVLFKVSATSVGDDGHLREG